MIVNRHPARQVYPWFFVQPLAVHGGFVTLSTFAAQGEFIAKVNSIPEWQ